MSTSFSGRARWGAVGLAALLALLPAAGCKKSTPSGPVKAEEEGPTRQDIQRGIAKNVPAVGRFNASTDLRTLAQLYSTYAAEQGKGPSRLEDLDLQKDDPKLLQHVKDGEYVVVWGVNPQAGGQAIVAYQKDVPTKGGMVARLGGSVDRVTAQEFQAQAKAGGAP
jgi:hypothetical protein